MFNRHIYTNLISNPPKLKHQSHINGYGNKPAYQGKIIFLVADSGKIEYQRPTKEEEFPSSKLQMCYMWRKLYLRNSNIYSSAVTSAKTSGWTYGLYGTLTMTSWVHWLKLETDIIIITSNRLSSPVVGAYGTIEMKFENKHLRMNQCLFAFQTYF